MPRVRSLAIIAAAVLALAAQRPPDETNVPPSEKRIPPGDYCKRAGVPIGPRETHAHSCECHFSCTVDENGTITQHEDASCQAFCHRNGRRCTCHVEEPCPNDRHGNALMDMDGRVVAVHRHGS